MGEIEPLPGVEQPLVPGDVVLAVNGAEVAAFEDLYRIALEADPPGPMQVRIERDGETLDLDRALSTAADGAGGRAPVAGQRRRAARWATSILTADGQAARIRSRICARRCSLPASAPSR